MKREQLNLPLYLSMPHPCSYLPDQAASSLFVDPDFPMSALVYSRLIPLGFRRSGDMVYRPRCSACSQCRSARIPVNAFHPRRRHRRTMLRNSDCTVTPVDNRFREEHFALYRRYMDSRHSGSSMADPDPTAYRQFLVADWADTHFIEIRENKRLLAVAVTDQVDDGLSAVYTFFEPTIPQRSLGVFAILSQIRLAEQLALPHLYLGYWIRDCGKMRYKTDYRPVELFDGRAWRRFNSDQEPMLDLS